MHCNPFFGSSKTLKKAQHNAAIQSKQDHQVGFCSGSGESVQAIQTST